MISFLFMTEYAIESNVSGEYLRWVFSSTFRDRGERGVDLKTFVKYRLCQVMKFVTEVVLKGEAINQEGVCRVCVCVCRKGVLCMNDWWWVCVSILGLFHLIPLCEMSPSCIGVWKFSCVFVCESLWCDWLYGCVWERQREREKRCVSIQTFKSMNV